MKKFAVAALALIGIGLTSACSTPAETAVSDVTSVTIEQVEEARADKSTIYDSTCYASYESPELGDDCELVTGDSGLHVVLIGDSHSAQWVPALVPIAEAEGWNLEYQGKRACSFSVNEHDTNEGVAYPSCADWNTDLMQHLLEELPDVAIIGNYARTKVRGDGEILDNKPGAAGEAALAEGMRKTWSALTDAGIDVVVMRDTPYPGFNVPDCLEENLTSPEACTPTEEEALENIATPELIAANNLEGATVVDLTSAICADGVTCPAVQEDIIVWRDKHHLTASYAASLKDVLADELAKVPALSR